MGLSFHHNDEHDHRECDPQWCLVAFLYKLDGKVDQIMADITALNAAVAEVEEAEAAAAEEFRALATEIENLEAGDVPQSAIDSLTERATAAAKALTEATTGAESQVEPTPEPNPSPTEPTKPVYVHEVDQPVDANLWVSSGFQTDEETPRPLYYSSADSEGGEPTGAVEGEWSVYTGPVKATA